MVIWLSMRMFVLRKEVLRNWILQIFWQLKVWGSLKNLLLCLNCVD